MNASSVHQFNVSESVYVKLFKIFTHNHSLPPAACLWFLLYGVHCSQVIDEPFAAIATTARMGLQPSVSLLVKCGIAHSR